MKSVLCAFFLLLLTLQVTAQSEPTPYMPANGMTTGVNPELRINNPNSSQFIRFQFQADTTLDFDSPLRFESAWSVSGIYRVNYDSMFFNKTYYWRLRSVKRTGTLYDTTGWSTEATFNTGLKPYLGTWSKNVNFQNVFGDITVYGAGSRTREYELDTTLDFNSPMRVIDTLFNSSQNNIGVEGLKYGTRYYFRTRDLTSVSSSVYSDTATVTVAATGAYISYPSNNSSFYAPAFFAEISTHNKVDLFEIQLDTAATFDSPVLLTKDFQRSSPTRVLFRGDDMLINQTYYTRVRAIVPQDTSAWSATNVLTTRNVPYLSSPANGATYQSLNVKIDYTGINRVKNEIQVDTVPDFSSSVLKQAIIENQDSNASDYYSISQSFGNYLFNTKYYYRARFFNSIDTSDWSSVNSFTTLAPYTRITYPYTNSEHVDNVPQFSWNSVKGIGGYHIQLSKDSFQQVDIDKYVIGADSFFTTIYLDFNTHYDARIRIFSGADTTPWLHDIHFKTWLPFVQKLVPYDSAGVLNDSIPFQWASAGPGFSYEIGVWEEKHFNKRIFTDSTSDTIFYYRPPARGKIYFWDVKVIDGNYKNPSWYYYRDWAFVPVFTAPKLTLPLDGALNQPLNGVILRWDALPGAKGYDVEVDLNPSFTGPLKNSVPVNNSVLSNLPPNRTYYWRVRAYNDFYGGYSNTFTFSTGNGGPSSVNGEVAGDKVNVYPNPFTSQVLITLPAEQVQETSVLRIIAADGRIVKEKQFTGSEATLYTGDLPAGVYVYQLNNSQGTHTGKIVRAQ